MKFKVGDKVRISEDAIFYPNSVGEIIEIIDKGGFKYFVLIPMQMSPSWWYGDTMWFTESELELVEEESI